VSETRSFRRAAKKQFATQIQEDQPVIKFDLTTTVTDQWGNDVIDEETGEPAIFRQDWFHATKPDDDAILAAMGRGATELSTRADVIAATVDLFREALPEREFQVLQRRLRDPKDDVNLSMLLEVFDWLQEQWTGFPTSPATGSSAPQRPSGTRSTGRSPGAGSSLSMVESPGSSD
jgi:hypothetical protein